MPTVVKAGGGVSKTKLVTANTQAANVKENTKFVDKDGNVQNGTMPDKGAISANVSANASYTIPAGYHNGQGTVTGPTLNGNATAADVKTGLTFYKDSATQLTGSMPNRGSVTASVKANNTYTIPAGYHDGTGKVSGPTLNGNANVGDVKTGLTFYKDSDTKLTGTMPNRGAVAPAALGPGGSYTVPAGFHNGSGKVTATAPSDYGTILMSGFSGGVTQNFTGFVNGGWYAVVVDSMYNEPNITLGSFTTSFSQSHNVYRYQESGSYASGQMKLFIGKATSTTITVNISSRSLYEAYAIAIRIG